MRKFFILCAALFCLSLTASAQDSTAAFDASNSAAEPAAPAPFNPPDRDPWQLGAGFQYVHFNVLGQKFHNFGFQANVTRFLNNWFGVEGTTIAGFGHLSTDSSQTANSFFIGGGPHIAAHSSSRLEPWVHAMIGWERFRFTQAGALGSNSGYAFIAGGGVDYKLGEGRLNWRSQADFIGTHVGSAITGNYSFGTGLVLNF